MSAFHDFVRKYNGKYVEFNNDGYKNQCVDLVQKYQKEVLKTPVTRGNGIDFDRNFDPRYYTYYRNTLLFVPKDGDIAVYNIWPYGHVDIVYVDPKNPANRWTFTAFSQNWPKGTPCHLIKHPMYRNVKGFLRRK